MYTQNEKSAADFYTPATISSLVAGAASEGALRETTNTRRSPDKPTNLLQENMDPARRAMMVMGGTHGGAEQDNFEAQILRAARSITNANTEELPFNRLENARAPGTENGDAIMEGTGREEN
jgi:hypothetical protein